MSQKIGIVVVLFLIPIALLAYLALSDKGPLIPLPTNTSNLPVVTIGNFAVRVEIAKTPEERRQGLSGRDQLEHNRGMLFVFDTPGLYGIWMRDMLIPIDILWLKEDGTIVDIKRNAVPESYPEVFYPSGQVSYVLELSANFTELHSVNIGDRVTLPESVLK